MLIVIGDIFLIRSSRKTSTLISDRRNRKRLFRALWIIRINAAARIHGLSYSRLINGLKRSEIEIDRKVLADIAVHDPDGFAQIAEKAKAGIEATD